MAEVDYGWIVSAIKKLLDESVASPVKSLFDRVGSVERQIASLPVPRDGKDADPEVVRQLVADGIAAALPAAIADGVAKALPDAVAKHLEQMERPKDGCDADPEVVRGLIVEEVERRVPDATAKAVEEAGIRQMVDSAVARVVGEIPRPQDGKDADPEVIRGMVADAVAVKSAEIDEVLSLVRNASDSIPEAVARAVEALPRPADGKDADPEVLRTSVVSEVERQLSAWPKPQDGKSITVEDVAPVIEEVVQKAVAAIPPAERGFGLDDFDTELASDGETLLLKFARGDYLETHEIQLPRGRDGKDADPEAVKALVDERVAEAVASVVADLPMPQDGAPGPKGEDGKDADPDLVKAMVEDAVSAAVALIPAGKDGEPGRDGKDVDPEAVKAMVEAAVAEIPVPKDGKDGVGLAGAVIDRDGNLAVTLSDGSVKELGLVVGRDGVAGSNGKDGRDGLGFDDLSIEKTGDRTFLIKFVRGDVVKEFPIDMPVVIDRGVWREGAFKAGDGVTLGGSYWIAQRDTEARPETSPDWRLAVKRGQNGRDGKPGAPGPTGPKGERGDAGPRGFGA